MPVQCTCLYCGRLFATKAYRLARGRGKYCSRGCAAGANKTKHGESAHRGGALATPEYRAWINIKSRCLKPDNPGYHNYGGRGITVCNRWRDSFDAFLEDAGRRPSATHSIHRIDNDGNYEPGNVKWATRSEQHANQRHGRQRSAAAQPRLI